MKADATEEIVEDELRMTEKSVANLDSICDTTLVGITFLFAGIATWGAFGFGEVSSGSISTTQAWPFLGFIVLSGVATTVAVSYIIRGLFPRQFYTEEVGETILHSTWLPGIGSGTSQSAILDRARSTTAEAYVSEFIESYDPEDEIETHEKFSKVKLRNLKAIAGIKAKLTGKGLLWFQLGVLFFLASLLYGGVLVVLSG
ncbi:hypothetical protein [Natrarchaeobius chitinivorans]|uniref:Uncharacterized protein n=1 Tax=Natrarchaeobius chitinivorans TaxID=1679083 RepID=A0A3N6LQD4_NATCH|nr:hypothetical protein [Natrarchaeobius chitinivorans]RQG91808.1 hypothetical protein EA473_18600 [Natrarchaeobius chitinivorans]